MINGTLPKVEILAQFSEIPPTLGQSYLLLTDFAITDTRSNVSVSPLGTGWKFTPSLSHLSSNHFPDFIMEVAFPTLDYLGGKGNKANHLNTPNKDAEILKLLCQYYHHHLLHVATSS